MPKSIPKLPPGPSFILHRLFSWEVASYSGFFYFLHVGAKRINANVPLWVTISSSVVALPALFLVQCQFDIWMNRRKARSLGGRLVPVVPTKWPGGIDLVVDMINVFKSGYLGKFWVYDHDCALNEILPGDEIVDWLADSGGQTVDIRTLWSSHVRRSSLPTGLSSLVRSQILTTEPQYIKVASVLNDGLSCV